MVPSIVKGGTTIVAGTGCLGIRIPSPESVVSLACTNSTSLMRTCATAPPAITRRLPSSWKRASLRIR